MKLIRLNATRVPRKWAFPGVKIVPKPRQWWRYQ